MEKENVTPKTPTLVLTPTPELPDAGNQAIHKQAGDSAETEAPNDVDTESNKQVKTA